MLSSLRECILNEYIFTERKEIKTMQVFTRKPTLDLYHGIRVDKDTNLEYKNEHVEQKVENLILHSVQRTSTDDYDSTYDITVRLKEGDVLIFEEEGRGYIKPIDDFVTIAEAIEDFENIKDLR